MAMVLVLSYIVLLFFYLLYKLGICGCIGHTLCRISWACLVSWLSFWEYCCTFLWVKLIKLKRRNRRRNIEEEFDSGEEEYYDESFSCDTSRGRSLSRREIDYRRIHLRKSLRPRSHHVRVGIYTDSIHGHRRKPSKHHNPSSTVHDIRVTHTSKFVKKGTNSKGRAIYRSTSTNMSPI
ncbi:hypothetical protein QYF36_014378 [Acer negundo]|nr:hypothetical protein QYF36_014378 [Acer negundo]